MGSIIILHAQSLVHQVTLSLLICQQMGSQQLPQVTLSLLTQQKMGELTGNNNDCNITKSSINTDLDSIVDTYSTPGTMYSTPYKQDDNNHSEDTSFSDTWEYIYSNWLEDDSSSYGPDMYDEEIISETSTSHTGHHSPSEYVAEVTISDYGESLWDSA